MIGIRVDGNRKIGTGHVMRCISVATELEKLGQKPLFFSVDAGDIIKTAKFACVDIPGTYDDLASEKLDAYLAQYEIDKLLIDTYFADSAYFERIPEGVKTACFFDLGDSAVACDLLINYNINWEDYAYPNARKTLLGGEYAPLREEFREEQKERKFERVSSVMVTTGGSDVCNVTGKLIKAVCAERTLIGVNFEVVIGGLNVHTEEIKQAAWKSGNIICYEKVAKMSVLMQKCDVAISAGGSTLYEICASGLPCVTFSIAENQDRMIEAMQEQEVMLSAGVFWQDEEACVDRMMTGLKRLIDQTELRKALSEKERSIVDGYGAARIAETLVRLQKE